MLNVVADIVSIKLFFQEVHSEKKENLQTTTQKKNETKNA